jgi:hypothetical protein
MDETHRHYLRDLGYLIRERAEESAQAAKAARQGPDAALADFEAGRRLAYYEVVSLMLGQAETFGVSAEDLAMAGFDPDRDLLAGDA